MKFDSVYISSKKRCNETARIILGKDFKCKVDPRLDERNFGIFENKTYEEGYVKSIVAKLKLGKRIGKIIKFL